MKGPWSNVCGGERERMGQGTESGRQEDEGGGTGAGDGGKRPSGQ